MLVLGLRVHSSLTDLLFGKKINLLILLIYHLSHVPSFFMILIISMHLIH